MSTIMQLLQTTLGKVLLAFAHNWVYLLASILVGSLIKQFLDKDRKAAYLRKYQNGVIAIVIGTLWVGAMAVRFSLACLWQVD
jgi:uncharacterized membrane protein YraQ (UPF0718 family)